jgi:hypothetical protein
MLPHLFLFLPLPIQDKPVSETIVTAPRSQAPATQSAADVTVVTKSYGSVTPKLMEGIMREIELLIRYCNLVFIGLLSSRMPVSLFYLVMNVNE